jgi:ubiquinone/menaquinone biosynthesis C-methylase UbiE
MTTTTKASPDQHVGFHSQFSGVDGSGDAGRLIAFLENIERLPSAVAMRQRTYDLLHLRVGDRVVDVGCGPGKAVAELLERGIQATGVDNSQAMIRRAQQRFPSADFRLGPAEGLPFRDGYLHGYRAERVYSHLADPRPALAEARRALAPGGRFVLIDVENDLWIIDSDDQLLVRRLVRALADTVANPWIGRSGRALLTDAGFEDVTVELQPHIATTVRATLLEHATAAGLAAGVVTRHEADAWMSEQQRRSEQGRFFAANPFYVVSARQP